MTTIACDGRSIAGDGLITNDDTVLQKDFQKVFRLDDGRVIGFAGSAYDFNTILDFFNKKICGWPKIPGNSAIMILDVNGIISIYNSHGQSCNRPAPASIGSGRFYALGAMDAGADSESACRIACNRDVLSGGTVSVLTPQ